MNSKLFMAPGFDPEVVQNQILDYNSLQFLLWLKRMVYGKIVVFLFINTVFLVYVVNYFDFALF